MNVQFFCGNSIEEWSPKSELTGVGGSEEAVINIARELAKLGHAVTVWNRCGDAEGEYEGVRYENYEFYDAPECDILIVWRQAEYIAHYGRKNAKKCFLWLHDVVPEHDVLPVKLMVDGVFVLSEYHATFYPHLKEKLIGTQNGINVSMFEQEVTRDPYKIVYGSSYDRGLKELLEMWGEVKTAVPQATLTYFYGDEGLKKGGHDDFLEQITHLSNQEGVTCLGRIGHADVAREFQSAGVWAYPTWFPEISCITAMKAQVGGAIPVVTPTAALMETVRWGLTTREPRDEKGSIPWGTTMPQYLMDLYVKLLIKSLDPDFQAKYRLQMVEDAKRTFDWRVVAGSWDKMFRHEDSKDA